MKKLLVLVFAIALCLGVLCVGASADYSGKPEKPTQGDGTVDDPYKISSAENLYWFAGLVNGDTNIIGSEVQQNKSAHAVLTDNITINTGVLKTDGSLNSGSFTQWTPICGKKIGDNYTKYTGTFDGDGHTISGLYYDGSGDYVGLFGYVGSNGRVQNVKVADSYISNSEGTGRTGGVCGYNSGTIMNCSFSGSVTCNNASTYVGGVCGGNSGTTENCYNAGTVTSVGSKASVGGVCGYNGSGSTIRNCYNTGAVNGENTGDGYFYAGGVCGSNKSTGVQNTITNCYNTGSVAVSVTGSGNGNIYAGGVCGNSVSYYNTVEVTITDCYNTGSVTVSVTGSGNGNICAGGVCGSAYRATITNCYNTGSVTGSNNGSSSLCVGGVCGSASSATITNCYWLSGTASDINATEKTAEEFASGEVAWLLNQGQTNGPWRQTLSGDADTSPVLDIMHKEVVKLTVDDTVRYLNKGDSFTGENGKVYYDSNNERVENTFTVYEDTSLTSKLLVTVTADDKTAFVGDAMPALTYTFAGFEEGETFTESPVVSCTPDMNEAGAYTITVSGGEADKKYAIDYVDGTLTVKPSWTVTVKYENGDADESSYVHPGGTFKLPAAPSKSGYTFVHWSDGNKTYDPGDSVPITGNVTFTAVWQAINIPDPNGITVTQPANGTIRVNPSNGSAGTLITVTATPDEGYELAYITVDGEKITGNTFRMPDKAVTVSAVFVPVTFPFTDVKSGDWFYDYVAYVYSNGLMDGTSDTAFEPNANMTRAMVWAILARVDGENVTGAAWATDARAWAMAEGVSDGTDPNGLVTREQFATMLYRYAVAKGYDVSIGESTNILSYADFASISEYAIPAMQWACGSGIVTGVTDSTLAPQGTATRAQCAAMLMRFVEL